MSFFPVRRSPCGCLALHVLPTPVKAYHCKASVGPRARNCSWRAAWINLQRACCASRFRSRGQAGGLAGASEGAPCPASSRPSESTVAYCKMSAAMFVNELGAMAEGRSRALPEHTIYLAYGIRLVYSSRDRTIPDGLHTWGLGGFKKLDALPELVH